MAKKKVRGWIINPKPPKGKMDVLRFPKAKLQNYHLYPDNLPDLAFRGRRIGSASWPAIGFRKRQKGHEERAELDLYRLSRRRYIAHIHQPNDYDEIYAGSSILELLDNFYDWSTAKAAVVRIVGPTLRLNNPADFAKLVAITKRGD